MKKYQKLVFVLWLFLTIQNVSGQDSLKQEIRLILCKNVLRLDEGLAYERLLWQSGKHKIGASVFGNTRKAEYNSNTQANLSYSHRLYYFGTGLHYFYGKRNRHLELSLHYAYGSGVVWEGEWLTGETFGTFYRVRGGYSSHYHVLKQGNLQNDPEIQRMIEEKQNFEIDNRTYQFYRSNRAAFRIGYRYQRTNGGFFFRVGVSLVNLVWYQNSTPARLTILGTSKNTFDNVALPYLGLGWSF